MTSADVARPLGGNLEATARRVRYEFFAAVAAKSGRRGWRPGTRPTTRRRRCCTGCIRGTGLQGLRGIAASKSDAPAPKPEGRRGDHAGRALTLHPWPLGVRSPLLRPLLTVTRADVLAYLAAIGPAVPRGRHERRPAVHPQPHPRTNCCRCSARSTRTRVRPRPPRRTRPPRPSRIIEPARRPACSRRPSGRGPANSSILDAAAAGGADPYLTREALRARVGPRGLAVGRHDAPTTGTGGRRGARRRAGARTSPAACRCATRAGWFSSGGGHKKWQRSVSANSSEIGTGGFRSSLRLRGL